MYFTALEQSHFMEYVDLVPGFGRKMGESVTIPLIAPISEPTSAVLTENSNIPETTFSLKKQVVTVVEYGQAVPFSGLIEELDHYDPQSWIQRRLVDQEKLTLDTAASVAFKATQIVAEPTGVAALNIDTGGSPTQTATANLNYFAVEQIRDYLFDTLLAPPYEGDDYMAIVRTLGLRGIKRDPLWQDWHQYKEPEAKASGEVGRIENVVFVETNHANALGTVPVSSPVLGQAVFFGAEAVALAEALTPELRASVPSDFGRQRAIAWYGILGFQILWSSNLRGEAKIVFVTSS